MPGFATPGPATQTRDAAAARSGSCVGGPEPQGGMAGVGDALHPSGGRDGRQVARAGGHVRRAASSRSRTSRRTDRQAPAGRPAGADSGHPERRAIAGARGGKSVARRLLFVGDGRTSLKRDDTVHEGFFVGEVVGLAETASYPHVVEAGRIHAVHSAQRTPFGREALRTVSACSAHWCFHRTVRTGSDGPASLIDGLVRERVRKMLTEASQASRADAVTAFNPNAGSAGTRSSTSAPEDRRAQRMS
jgi:hypothetical protein